MCERDPDLKTAWGCEEPTQNAVWAHGENEYFNCPLKFIPETIWQWFEELQYCQKFLGTALNYKKQSAKFVDALFYYDSMAINIPRGRDRTKDNLDLLKKSFHGRTNNS